MKLGIVIAAALLTAACGLSPAQQERISATQAVVDERVRAGTMTPAEGRLAIAKVKADMEAENQRNRAARAARASVYQPVGGGTVIQY